MSKKLLSSVIVLAAVAVPTFALAETKKAGVEKEGNRYSVTTPEITTARGSENPPTTDVGDLSRKNPRDFVKDPTGFSGAANLGFGLGDAYGLGLGARAGYTLPRRVYVGGLFGYHVGNTAETQGVSISNKTWYFGPEAGYDIGVGKVILRPVVGLGLAFRNQSASNIASAEPSETDMRLYVAPGASVVYPIGNFFLGADTRTMIMSGNTSQTFMAAAGAHL